MKTIVQRTLIFSAFIVGLCFTGRLASDALLRSFLDPKIAAHRMRYDKFKATFLNDLTILKEDSPFKPYEQMK